MLPLSSSACPDQLGHSVGTFPKGKHRSIKQRGASAPCHSEAYQSFGLRRAELIELLEDETSQASTFSSSYIKKKPKLFLGPNHNNKLETKMIPTRHRTCCIQLPIMLCGLAVDNRPRRASACGFTRLCLASTAQGRRTMRGI